MSKLDAADRKAMPKGDFAGPGKSFPINDAPHARLAISGATRSERAGNISSSEEAKIKAKARHKLRNHEYFFGKGK
jgi:hypothetical protein